MLRISQIATNWVLKLDMTVGKICDWHTCNILPSHYKGRAVICGHTRPVLATHPFALGKGEGWRCALECFYHVKPNSTLCKTLSLVFPEVPPQKTPWGVKAYGGNYSCITGTGMGFDYGRLPAADCNSNITINATWPVKGLNQTKGVADVWWMCGPNRHLTPVLRDNWQGTCALASLIIQLTIIEVTANQLLVL
jgi:hypothetical protein